MSAIDNPRLLESRLKRQRTAILKEIGPEPVSGQERIRWLAKRAFLEGNILKALHWCAEMTEEA